jgi:hypothetical protein
MSSRIPDMAGIQEAKFWAAVHAAWLLIERTF